MSREPALVLEDVLVQWRPGAAPVLTGVNLSLAAGERAALTGLNGSGKTSLLLAAVGVAPSRGVIRIVGTTLTPPHAAAVRRQVGFLFNPPEDQLLFPQPLEDVAQALLQRGEEPHAAHRRAAAVLSALGVGAMADRPVHELSHGQKQWVALAGVVAAEPPLLLLDEPSAGLDPVGRRELARLLASLPAAMLVATHDLDFATRVCRRFLLLEGGTLAWEGNDVATVRRRWRLDDPQW